MKRTIYDSLLEWKNKKNRKPLILYGARQTGKTWILKEFGKNEYRNVAYINCDNNPVLSGSFFDFDTERLIRTFSAVTNEVIRKEETLIILDEIQEIPLALTSLKYYQENAPEYHIVVAGSLLGISVHAGTGFPVGKVDEMTLYPMSFTEFLMANGKDMLIPYIKSHDWMHDSGLNSLFQEQLRQYYYTGGMPEVVQYYVETQNLIETRNIQKRILRDYEQDFSKHIPASQLAKVRLVYHSVPAQIAKENKKFIFSALKKGARAKEFEDAIQWLVNAGLVYKVNRVKKIDYPLKHYEDFDGFKLFVSDLGLLGAMNDTPASQVLIGDSIFTEYKGSFTEQYICQEILSAGCTPYYYSNDNSTMKIDFVIQKERIYPIEVKAEENLRSKSLRTVLDSNTSLFGWRFSMSGYREQDRMVNVPLYYAQEWMKSNQ
ncbi:MAG: ATP-binding protein [Erysipelotrichaceae bacterium]|nr:ATP-binding protein [Erysipelotrichaceae bacterium]